MKIDELTKNYGYYEVTVTGEYQAKTVGPFVFKAENDMEARKKAKSKAVSKYNLF